jgi:hypothetical protein
MRRTECSGTVKNILCEALLNFAYFSEDIKIQSDKSRIRKDILALSHEIEQQFTNSDQTITLEPQAYNFCVRAIHYHYDRIYYLLNTDVGEQRKLMLDFLQGKPTRDEHLDAALIRDNLI